MTSADLATISPPMPTPPSRPAPDIRDRPLAERDPYTSLVWLAGRPRSRSSTAARCERHVRCATPKAAQTPGSQAKGDTGPAARPRRPAICPARRPHMPSPAAATWISSTASSPPSASAATIVAPPIRPPSSSRPRPAPPSSRAKSSAPPPARPAAPLAGSDAVRPHHRPECEDRQDHVLAGELARELARPDLGVIVSRAPRAQSGARDPIRIGFPMCRCRR
jgi:soluble lytic murein transglycosylase